MYNKAKKKCMVYRKIFPCVLQLYNSEKSNCHKIRIFTDYQHGLDEYPCISRSTILQFIKMSQALIRSSDLVTGSEFNGTVFMAFHI